jgi:hypothetical protein
VTAPDHLDALARIDAALAEVKMLEAIPVGVSRSRSSRFRASISGRAPIS